MFCVSVKLGSHLDILTFGPVSWTLRVLEIWAWGQSGTVLKGQNSQDVEFSLGDTKGLLKGICVPGPKGLEPTTPFIHSFSPTLYQELQWRYNLPRVAWCVIPRSSRCRPVPIHVFILAHFCVDIHTWHSLLYLRSAFRHEHPRSYN